MELPMPDPAPMTSLPIAPAALVTAPSASVLPAAFNSVPSFDPLDLLPGGAQERLRKLRQRSVDAHAIIPSFSDLQTASTDRVEAEVRLRQLTSHSSEGGFGLHPENRGVLAQKKLVQQLSETHQRLKTLQETRSEQWRAASQALVACEDWLRNGRPGGCLIEAVEDRPLSELLIKNDGGRIDAAVERCRLRLRELAADRHRLHSAPWPSKMAKQAARAMIERLADAGAPDLDVAIEHGQPISFAQTTLRSAVLRNLEGQPTIAHTETIDVLGTMCWLFRDQIVSKIEAELDQIADDGNALDQSQRERVEAEIDASVLAVERAECSLIWHADAKGEQINFRSATSPQAVLGIQLVAAPRAVVPDSDPLHAYDVVGRRR
jgi:hypothetical protein